MNSSSAEAALISLLSSAGLCWLAFWRYRAFCVDRFRHRMFTLRDQLFDDAAEGVVGFDHPAYGLLRSTMNGFIRFGHRLGWLGLFLFYISLRNEKEILAKLEGSSFEKRLHELAASLDRKSQERMHWYLTQMNYLALQHLITSSPFVFLVILTPLTFLYVARSGVERIKNYFKDFFDRADSAAMAYGQP